MQIILMNFKLMQQLINQLNYFNEQDFPKELVTKSLENKLLDLSEISEMHILFYFLKFLNFTKENTIINHSTTH